jgi:hypothetical protein
MENNDTHTAYKSHILFLHKNLTGCGENDTEMLKWTEDSVVPSVISVFILNMNFVDSPKNEQILTNLKVTLAYQQTRSSSLCNVLNGPCQYLTTLNSLILRQAVMSVSQIELLSRLTRLFIFIRARAYPSFCSIK